MEEQKSYQGYVLIHNISKPKNIGTIIRSASAFNLEKVFLISKDDGKNSQKLKHIQKEFKLQGNQGTSKEMEYQTFTSLKDAKQYFNDNKMTVCGVEITKDSQNIATHPFKGNTVFFLGNEGEGINQAHREYCDYFVYIPQYTEKTASLNVACAASIIFHHFAIWAQYKEVDIKGEKFQINKKQQEPNQGENLQQQNKAKQQTQKLQQEENNDNNQNQNKKKICIQNQKEQENNKQENSDEGRLEQIDEQEN